MKNFIKNKSLCPLPFAGLYIQPNGNVKCCSISQEVLGNTHNESIESITQSKTVKKIRRDMLDNKFPKNCLECYNKEKAMKNFNFNQISNRLYHIGKLGVATTKLYKDENSFELQQLDVRWRNTCNGACVYCGPTLSSRWASELGLKNKMDEDAMQTSIDYVYKNLASVKMLYLCGGEPLMMKENIKLLEIISKVNPNLDIRVNTNLSNVDNDVFKLLVKLPNVQWILSAEAMEEKFEYIRFPLKWKNFIKNFHIVKQLKHKISLNMSWNILNAFGIFEFIDYMQSVGLHQNAFVLNPVDGPTKFSVRNLPNNIRNKIKNEAIERHGRLHEPFMLKYSYEAIIEHCKEPQMKKLQELKKELSVLDLRRNLNSTTVFPDLYEILNDY